MNLTQIKQLVAKVFRLNRDTLAGAKRIEIMQDGTVEIDAVDVKLNGDSVVTAGSATVLQSANNLSDLIDVDAAQANLDLVSQTSTLDDVLGHVLKVGAFGLGSGVTNTLALIADLNSVGIATGFYRGDATTLNRPAGVTYLLSSVDAGDGIILQLNEGVGTSDCVQIYFDYSQNYVFIRTNNGSGFTAWNLLYPSVTIDSSALQKGDYLNEWAAATEANLTLARNRMLAITGLGTAATSLGSVSNADSINKTGIFTATITTSGGSPDGSSGGDWFILNFYTSSTNAFQLAHKLNEDGLYVRFKNNTWSLWNKFLGTGAAGIGVSDFYQTYLTADNRIIDKDGQPIQVVSAPSITFGNTGTIVTNSQSLRALGKRFGTTISTSASPQTSLNGLYWFNAAGTFIGKIVSFTCNDDAGVYTIDITVENVSGYSAATNTFNLVRYSNLTNAESQSLSGEYLYIQRFPKTGTGVNDANTEVMQTIKEVRIVNRVADGFGNTVVTLLDDGTGFGGVTETDEFYSVTIDGTEYRYVGEGGVATNRAAITGPNQITIYGTVLSGATATTITDRIQQNVLSLGLIQENIPNTASLANVFLGVGGVSGFSTNKIRSSMYIHSIGGGVLPSYMGSGKNIARSARCIWNVSGRLRGPNVPANTRFTAVSHNADGIATATDQLINGGAVNTIAGGTLKSYEAVGSSNRTFAIKLSPAEADLVKSGQLLSVTLSTNAGFTTSVTITSAFAVDSSLVNVRIPTTSAEKGGTIRQNNVYVRNVTSDNSWWLMFTEANLTSIMTNAVPTDNLYARMNYSLYTTEATINNTWTNLVSELSPATTVMNNGSASLTNGWFLGTAADDTVYPVGTTCRIEKGDGSFQLVKVSDIVSSPSIPFTVGSGVVYSGGSVGSSTINLVGSYTRQFNFIPVTELGYSAVLSNANVAQKQSFSLKRVETAASMALNQYNRVSLGCRGFLNVHKASTNDILHEVMLFDPVYKSNNEYRFSRRGGTVSRGWVSDALNAYPIGSIWESSYYLNPAKLFGGKWAQFGEGRVLVGTGEGIDTKGIFRTFNGVDSNIDTNETGGVYVTELPQHAHGINTEAVGLRSPADYGRATYTTASTTNDYGGTTLSAGVASPENLPPYVVVYRWKRVA